MQATAMVVVVVLVMAASVRGTGPVNITQQQYPGFTPIAENCSQSLVELLLLRQEVYLSRLLDTETDVALTLKALANTVTQLAQDLTQQRQIQETLDGECTSPWSVVGDTCLLLALGERLTWGESLQYCSGRGSRLAAFIDANTYTQFLNYINDINTENIAVGVWVGGTDEEVEGVWKWVTGQAMPKGPPFWGSTNSYKAEPSGGRGENCAVLHHPDKYYMHDITCSYRAAPLCQKTH